MVLNLESPFKEIWRKAYLRVGKDGRKRVDLVNWPDSRTTISYARYLLSVKECRFLEDWEEADHKDGDRTNDELSNLQILTKDEHKAKTKVELSGLTILSYLCANCGNEFERRQGQVRGENPFCSRACNAKYNRKHNGWIGNYKELDETQINNIMKLRQEGLSDYKISDILKIERTKIYRERKRLGIP